MTINDVFLAPLYFMLILSFARRYRDKHYSDNSPLKKYFMPGLVFKLLGSVGFSFIYQFYYADGTYIGGDSGMYYQGSTAVYQAWTESPSDAIELFSIRAGEYTPNTEKYTYQMSGFWRANVEQFTLFKIVGTIELLALGTYLPLAFIISFFAFTGQWKIFEILGTKYPNIARYLAMGCLFIPSVIFWGGGVLKDPLCMGALGWIFYSVYKLIIQRRNVVQSLVRLPLMSLLLLELKAYILLTFVAAAMVWIYFSLIGLIKATVIRIAVSSVLVLGLVPMGYVILSRMASLSAKYSIENLKGVAEGFQSYHTTIQMTGEAGSGYTLAMSSFSVGGMIKVFPAAVNVSLFRPYLWEARSPIILLSALESLFCLFFTIYIFWKGGAINFFKGLANPEVAFCITFCLIMGFAIGITAFNFGALSRFRIPVLPFYVCGLIIMNQSIFEKRQAQREEKEKKLAKQRLA